MKRNIVKIHEEKCNGCGLCVTSCHEGAIEIVDGKARLISDKYCDGLGNCLPACPTNAIEIIEREADEFDEIAVEQLLKQNATNKDAGIKAKPIPCGCPGTMAKKLQKPTETPTEIKDKSVDQSGVRPSELSQWPVQLKLVHPQADFFENADVLVAADCTAFAYGDFHKDFVKGKVVLIGCPKLDDNQYYVEKMTEIIAHNSLNSITVVRMEVPCCGGIIAAVKEAMLKAQTIIPYHEVIIGVNGDIVRRT